MGDGRSTLSSAELDLAVEVALAAGALGARMTGGGFGGCAIALVTAAAAGAVLRAFAGRGLRSPAVFAATPVDGVCRA